MPLKKDGRFNTAVFFTFFSEKSEKTLDKPSVL